MPTPVLFHRRLMVIPTNPSCDVVDKFIGPALAPAPLGPISTYYLSPGRFIPTFAYGSGYPLAIPVSEFQMDADLIPFSTENGSGDRLEDLIHQLTKPKEPQLQRRLTWRCVSFLPTESCLD
jgi:hypothetical protein